MASYAPLFANTEGWQWAPDLIWVDNLNVYGTPNYHVQKLFSLNKGTHTISALIAGKPASGSYSLYASAVIDKVKKEIIVKIANTAQEEKSIEVVLEGLKKLTGSGTSTIIKAELQDRNSMEKPALVSPSETKIKLKGKTASVTLPANSFVMIKAGYH